ncbi:MAG: hypothetical protein ACKV2Q_20190 [Planctomycetaceae bacterium]
MSSEIEQRYRQYVDYIRITNARSVRNSNARPNGVQLRLTAPSMAEFSEWWSRISSEPETLARWTQRLDAPEEDFERRRAEMRACFESLPLAPAA